jgi:small subunit ribosomal protein S14
MKIASKKDNRKRLIYKKYELEKNLSKIFLYEGYRNKSLFIKGRYLGKYISKHGIKNRCVLTSRPKGIMSFFRLSRMSFKEKTTFGYIAGIRKSSW